MTDISLLFQKDPLDLSEQDLDAIILRFRGARSQFNKGNMQAGSSKPLTQKQKDAKEIAAKISLDDLL